jgi:putative addiction module component (TIGR02574 family)
MIDIQSLSPAQRLELIELLWDSLAATPDAIPFTEAQRAELDRRLDELDRDGPSGVTAEAVLNGLDRLRT